MVKLVTKLTEGFIRISTTPSHTHQNHPSEWCCNFSFCSKCSLLSAHLDLWSVNP